MSLVFLARRLLDRLPRVAQRMFSLTPRPDVVPLTFKDVQRRRQQLHGDNMDRTPCGCPECRHVRLAGVANHRDTTTSALKGR